MNPKHPFQYAVKKYGIKNFVRTTLKIFDTQEEALALEAELVNEDFLARDDTYNLALGGNMPSCGNWKKTIYMYDVDGNFEMEFDGAIDAIRYLDPTKTCGGHITRAIEKHHTFLGHLFSYVKLDKYPMAKHLKNRLTTTMPYSGKKVGQYDKEGNLVKVFDTMTDCVKAGFKNAKQVAIGNRQYCKGYSFQYLD